MTTAQLGAGWLQSRVAGTIPYRLDQSTSLLEFSAVADITGDGNPEMVFSGWTFGGQSVNTPHAPAPLFILSPGTDGRLAFLATAQTASLTIPGTGDPQVGDFNNDGLQDVLFPGFTDFYPLPVASTLLLGSRSGTFEMRSVGPPIAAHSGHAVDIDGDGDLDLAVSAYHAIEQTSDNSVFRQVVALVNDGSGGFASYRTINVGPTDLTAGSTAVAADFDGDGRVEFVFGDAKENATGFAIGHVKLMSVPGTVGEGSAFTGASSRRIATGYFDDKAAFAGVQSGFDPEKSHEIETVVADVNGDGRLDLLMMTMLWSSGPDRFVPQILINQGNNVFADETDTRLPDFDTLRGASFHPVLFDINRDGHRDLILDGSPDFDSSTGHPHVGHLGADILLNDGTGRFHSVARTVLQSASDGMTSASTGVAALRDGGRMHFYGLSADGAPVWVQLSRGTAGGQEVAVALEHAATRPIFTGPAGSDPSAQGAAGFNELYYLNTNETARQAVQSGQYATGLAHFLAAGRAMGLASFAANSIVRGGASDENIALTAGNETAYGDAGNDTISGLAGNDAIYGGTGNNRMEGGAGNDWVDGDSGADTVLGGGDNDSVRGLDGDDLIQGEDGADDVNGNVGSDTVYGGAGIDIVRGGRGNDIAWGDDGGDLHVNGNIGADTVYGGGGNDALFGGQDGDILYGGAGDDTLSGDLGDDTLFGDAGVDRFQIRAGGGHDVAQDFSPGMDLIALAPGTAWTERSDGGAARIELADGTSLVLAGIVHEAFSASWVTFS